jgi:hypothetical protein
MSTFDERREAIRQEAEAFDAFLQSPEGLAGIALLESTGTYIRVSRIQESGMASVTFIDGDGIHSETGNAPMMAFYARDQTPSTVGNTTTLRLMQAVRGMDNRTPRPSDLVGWLKDQLEQVRDGTRRSATIGLATT